MPKLFLNNTHGPGRGKSGNKISYFQLYPSSLQRERYGGTGSKGWYEPTSDKPDSSPTKLASPGLMNEL